MKVRFQADADLNQIIVKATLRREPSIDFQTAQAANLPGLGDQEVLAIAASAEGDITYFRTYEQVLIVDAIDHQLMHEPHLETRNRKLLDPNTLAAWELRIGRYR